MTDEGLFHKGWLYLQQHQDKDYSLTDCVLFVVMQRLGIRVAYTFDKHFIQARFANQHSCSPSRGEGMEKSEER